MRFMTLKVIAYARNGHKDKFGIPRQSREESPILTRIVFEPEFAVPEALRGIEGYSHLWILWGFSEVESRKRLVSDRAAAETRREYTNGRFCNPESVQAESDRAE